MDSIDEIFDFLEVPSAQRIECLKHLLYSSRAKLNDSTKGKIVGRVASHTVPTPGTPFVAPVVGRAAPPSPPPSEAGSDESSKSRRNGKQMMEDEGLTPEMMASFNIVPSGKGKAGGKYSVKDVEQGILARDSQK